MSLLAITSVAQACPSCKEAVATADGKVADKPGRLGKGYSYSVLFMMAMPFALAAGFGGVCYYHFKKRPAGA